MPDDVYLGWMYEFGLAQYSDVDRRPRARLRLGAGGRAQLRPALPARRRSTSAGSSSFARSWSLNGDGAKPFWVLEFGWTTDQVNPQYSWYAVTPEQQADYIVKAYQYARTNWAPQVGPMFVWNIADPSLDAGVRAVLVEHHQPGRDDAPGLRRAAAARASACCRKSAGSDRASPSPATPLPARGRGGSG